nr:unnamed protein product [Callosobruchus chinensis]
MPSLRDLQIYIDGANYDAFCLSETWLNNNINDNVIQINGYNVYRQDRDTRGGGLCIYVKSKYMTTKIDSLNETIEQLWIQVIVNKEKWVIGTVYRPPSQDASHFLSVFEDTLGIVSVSSDVIICAGDLNINLYDMNSVHTSNLNCIFDTFHLLQVINAPTRITSNTATLIDLLMTSSDLSVLDCGTINTELSDHQLIYCFLKKQGITTPPKNIIVRDYKNLDIGRFQYDLARVPFFGIYDTESIDQKVSILEDNIIKLFNVHAPLKSVRCTKPPAPWLTDVIKIMIKIRDKELNKFKKNRTTASWNFYKKMRNLTTRAIQREKKAYFEYMLRNCNNKDRWRLLKSNKIISDKKYRCEIPEALNDVNKINDFFVNSLPDLNPADHLLAKYNAGSMFRDSFKLQAVDDSVILKIISEIKSRAVGDDGLNIIMIKLCFPLILPFVMHIINFCIVNSVYPASWKNAVVIPLPKKSVVEDYKDLRAISILPVLSKLIEKAVAMQLMEYLESKKNIASCSVRLQARSQLFHCTFTDYR